MIKVYYYRTSVNVFDERRFRNIDELNAWLEDMVTLKEKYQIYHIDIFEES